MLEQYLERFLQKHFSYQKPLLLGYSGGPDSEALLQLLLEVRRKKPFALHLVHIDHGWRKTSEEEANSLRLKAKALGLPFHLAKQSPSIGGNAEELARNFRYAYFKQLMEKYHFAGIFLAHHADDLAETVLKRMLEGAHLFTMGGMKPHSFYQGIRLFRPLLPFSKKELLAFLEEKNISFIHDATNEDVKFTRVKFRKKVFPFIQKEFGKNPTRPLQFFSKQTWELQEHLESRLNPILVKTEKTPFFHVLRLDNSETLSSLELRSLLYSFFEKRLSREQEDLFIEAIKEKKPSLSVDKAFFWDQETLYYQKREIPLLEGSFEQEGTYDFGPWSMEIQKTFSTSANSSWKDWLKGSFQFWIPSGSYHWDQIQANERFYGKSLREVYREKKVPFFLRESLPLLRKKSEAIFELASGKTAKSFSEKSIFWKSVIKIKPQ